MPSAALALAWHAFFAQPGAVARAPTPLVLEWRSSAGCEGGRDVELEVRRLLRAARGEERPVRASAQLSDDGHGALQVKLQLEVAGAPHERAFVAESCQAAKSAVALILAISINPAAVRNESSNEAARPDAESALRATPPQPAPAAAGSAPPQAVPPIADASREWGLDAGAYGLVDVGSMPRAAAGLGLRLGLGIAAARIELGGSVLSSQTVIDDTGAGARFSSLHAQLRFGYGARLGVVWLGPMAGVGLSTVTASGIEGSTSVSARDATELVPELSAGVLTIWKPVRRVGLNVGAELVAPLARPRFLILQPVPDAPTILHRSSAIGGRITLGLALHFL
jgi:hypothetical protein